MTALAIAIPMVTFATTVGPAGAIPPSKPICFGVNGRKGDVGIVNLVPVLATAGGNGQLVPLELYKNPPKAANVNFAPYTVDPNVAFSRLGAKGSVCFENSHHATVDLVADQLGTIPARYYKFAQSNGAPKRVMDSRDTRIIGPGQSRCFRVAGSPGDAAVVNLTPVLATGAGDGQLVSSDIRRNPPKAANVNFAAGTVDPNVTIARIGNNNQVCFINSKNSSVHVVADHLGTIDAAAYSPAQNNGAPQRVMDTRQSTIIEPGQQRCFTVSGRPGDAAVLNLTPVEATSAGNGLLVSSDLKNRPPIAANVNYDVGTVDPNIAIAKIGRDNQLCFLNSRGGSVHLIADHLGNLRAGAYAPARADGAPQRVVDTRLEAEVTPVSTQGPNPLRPSQVEFSCGFRYAGEFASEDEISSMIVIRGMDKSSTNRIRITRYNDYWAKGNHQQEFVLSSGTPNFGLIRSFLKRNDTPYDVEQWNQRIKIETFINTPSKQSSAVFDVSDVCTHGELRLPTMSQAMPQHSTDHVGDATARSSYVVGG